MKQQPPLAVIRRQRLPQPRSPPAHQPERRDFLILIVALQMASMSAGNALGEPGKLKGWHRVVKSDGRITGVFKAKVAKRQHELLLEDGVRMSSMF